MGKILISPFQSGPFSLRVRTLLTVGLTLLALSLVVVALSRWVVLDGFRDLENRTAQENVHRALNTLDSQAEALDISVMDWAYWDDTYQFAQDQNEDYREANLDYQSLLTLQINVMAFFDPSGHVLDSRAVDLNTGLDSQLPAGIEDAVNENRILLLLDGENRTFRGVLSLDDQLMLVAARPILTSERTGPPQGILLFGRFLDEAEIAYLAGTVYSPLVIEPYYDPQLPTDFQVARNALNGTNSIYIHQLNHDTIAGYVLARDMNGSPALIMRVDTPRDIYTKGLSTITLFVILAMGLGIILVGIMVLLLERVVLARLARLSKRVLEIGYTSDLTARVPVEGRDELAGLSHTINAMLETLQETQKTASESQERFQQVVNSISDCIYASRMDLDGNVLEHWILSSQIEILTGYSQERFVKDWNFWPTLIHPDDRPAAMENYNKLRSGEDIESEYRIITAYGQAIWVRDSAHSIDTSEGRMAYGVISDISARRRAEAALRKNEEKYTTAFQFSPDTILISRLDDGMILDANEMFFRVMGFSREDVLGKTLRELSHWVIPEHRKQMVHQLRDSGSCTNLETIFRTKDGQTIPMLVSACAIQVDEQVCALTIAHDIHERKQVEEALASERNLLRTLIDHMPDAVYVKDSQARLLLANQADLATMRADAVEDVLGKTDFDFYPRELAEKYFADDMQVIQTGQPLINREEQAFHATGQQRWVLTTKVPLRDTSGQVIGLVGTGRDITQRKRMEAALSISEERYRSLFDGVPIGIYQTMPTGQILAANQAMIQMFGYETEDEVLHLDATALYVNPEERERWQAELETESLVRDYEVQFKRRDGSTIWVRDVARTVRDEQGQVLYYEGSLEDITERKQTEAALREREEWLRTVINAMPDMVCLKDGDGRWLIANDYDRQLFEIADVDYVGKTDVELAEYTPFYRSAFLGCVKSDAVAWEYGGVSIGEEAIPRRESAPMLFQVVKVPLFHPDGSRRGLVVVGRDITERKRAEQALLESERLFRTAFENAAIGMALIHPNGIFLQVNEALCRMLGYTSGEMLRLSFQEITHPDDLGISAEHANDILSGKHQYVHFEKRYIHKDGYPVWMLISYSMLRDSDDMPLYYISQFQNITDRKQAEAERERLLGQMQARLTELATVAEVSLQASTILNPDDLLWTVSNLTQENFSLYHAHIYLVGDDHKTLLLAAGAGEAGHQMVAKGHRIPMAHERSLVARAARTRQGVIVNNVQEASDFLPNPLLPETLSEMAIPIIVGEQLIGVLDVQDRVLNRFTVEDINVQTTLAAQLAIAIHNARLFTENARRLAIIENSDDLIVLAAIERKRYVPVYINPAGMRLLGYEDRAFKDIKLEEACLWGRADDALQQGIWRGETELCRQDGSVFPVEETVLAIPNEHGKPRDLAVIATDITGRKQAEIALRRANRAFRALSDCNQAMVRATDEQSLLMEVCDIIVKSGGYCLVWVGMVERDNKRILPVAFSGREDGYLQNEIRWDYTPSGMGPTGHAIRSLQSQITHDIANDPNFAPWRDAALERGYASLVVLPLLYADSAFATLNVYSDQANAFDPEEIQLLTELTSDLAFGIIGLRIRAERLRAEKAEREQRILAEALSDTAAAINRTLDPDSVMDRILDNLKRVVPHDAANIMLIERDTARVVRGSGYGERQLDAWVSHLSFTVSENYLLRTVVETARPLVIPRTAGQVGWIHFPETEWVQSYACAPISREGEVVGFLSVYSAHEGFFVPEYSVRLQALADQAAIAIQNARLFAAEHEQRIMAEALSDTAAAVNSTLNFDEVLEQILTNIERVVPHQLANIMLLEGDMARIARHRGYTEGDLVGWAKQTRFSLDSTPTLRRMVDNHQPLLIPSVTDDDSWTDYAQTNWIQSYLGAPIIRDGKVIGFLNLDSNIPGFFNEVHAKRLQTFANQAATAISNAQLFTAERDQRAFSEALSDTAAAINSTLDPTMVMDLILENVKRTIPHDAATVMMLDDLGFAYIARDRDYIRSGDREWLRSLRLRADKTSNLRQMSETGRALILADVQNAPEWVDVPESRWIRSYLGAPIMREGEVIGFINLDSQIPNFFTPEHAERLQAFAAQAAIAIQNARLFTAEREQHVFVEALRDTAAAINSTLDFDEVLDRILTNLKQVMPHDVANIMQLEGGMIRIVDHRGYEERGLTEWARRMSIPLEQVPMLVRMVETAQAMVTSDTRIVENWALFPETQWVMSYIGAPICQEGQVLGFLNLYSETPGFFSLVHTGRLQAFADQAAIALRNARLFADERDQRTMAEAVSDTAAVLNNTLDFNEVLDRILANVGRVVPHDAANVMLVENGIARVVGGHGYAERGLGDWIKQLRYEVANVSAWQILIETRRPCAISDTWADPTWVRVPEEDWIRSTVKAPIYWEDELIGILHLDSEKPGFFTDAHADRLQTFANQAAIAIQNARLFADERDQRTLAEAVSDTAAVINSTLDFNEVLDRILANVGRVVPHDAANVMLIENGIARVARGRGYIERNLGEWIAQLRYSVKEVGIWQRMLISGLPFAVPDTNLDPDWVCVPEEEWIRSTVKAPIYVDNELIGILHLDSEKPGFFNDIHAQRLQTFANQAAIAIQNARLFTAEREQRDLAEALRDTAAAVTSTLDFNEVLDGILSNVSRVAPYDAAHLMLIRDGVSRVARSRPTPRENPSQNWTLYAQFNVDDTPNLHYMATTGKPIAIRDTEWYPGWVKVAGAEWVRSLAAAPIKQNGKVIGFLTLDSSTPGFYSQIHADRLQAFADQASMAIENAQLYDDIQLYAAGLESRVQERTAEVEAQRVQLQAILDAMGEGVIYTIGNQVIYANRMFNELLGYSTSEMVVNTSAHYWNMLASVKKYDQMMETMQRAFQRNLSWRGELRLRRKDNTEFDAAMTVTQVPSLAEDQPRGVVSIFRDISQEKALQAQRDRFIANASHELRTPLANIKTRLYLIHRQPDRLDMHLRVLERVADGMTELVENLLDVTRFERGIIPLHRRTIVLQDLLMDVVSVQYPEAERKGLNLHTDIIDDPIHVSVDPQRLSQVFTNLMTNAINYTSEGGTIIIKLDRSGDRAVFQISDTGIGIAPEMLEHVFDPFFRANEGSATGTGLGLTIAKEIVDLHSGDLRVDSEVGRGSTFTVKLGIVTE